MEHIAALLPPSQRGVYAQPTSSEERERPSVAASLQP
jgi:hypothetical protein